VERPLTLSNWGGVENALIGASDTVNTESVLRSEKKKVKKMLTFVFYKPLHGKERNVKDVIVTHTLERYFCVLSMQ